MRELRELRHESAYKSISTRMNYYNLDRPFSLVVLSCLATVSGAFETISACLVDEYPRLRQYKPAIAFTALVVAFLVNLALATQVGTIN